MDIHLVRVPRDVDAVNVRSQPVKGGKRPAFFQSMLTARFYATIVASDNDSRACCSEIDCMQKDSCV